AGSRPRSQMGDMMRERNVGFVIVGGAVADFVGHLGGFGVGKIMQSQGVGGGSEIGEERFQQGVQLGRGLGRSGVGKSSQVSGTKALDGLFEHLLRATGSGGFGGGG